MLNMEDNEFKEEQNNSELYDFKKDFYEENSYDVNDDSEFKNNYRHEFKGGSHSYQKPKSKKKIIIIIAIIVALLVAIVFGVIYFCGIPIIEYKGEKVQTLEYGSNYTEEGINVYTKLKNVSNKVIIEGNVDTSKIGTYNLTYKVPYFNDYKIYSRTVNIVDTKSPELTLAGDADFNLTFGTEYTEPGCTATDNYDGDLTESIKIEKVDIDSNNYEYHYTVVDSSGNKSEKVRKIKIIDNVAPNISLKGSSVISVQTGKEYKEQGATAIDNKDGDISSKIAITGKVDTSKEGTYTITYSVSDENGNKSEVSRKVNVGKANATGVIYLTFDDGPSTSITPKILDVLKEKGVNATFFIINYNDQTEKLVKRAVEEGNAIGIHGYSHDYSKIYTSVDACYSNITKLQDKIYETTGQKTKILRFPGGSSNTVSRKYCQGVMTGISQKVLSEGFKYYDWNVMSGDSGDVKTREAVYNNVTKGLKPGRDNIVLMHDFSGNNKTLDALPDIIDYGLANGYTFEVITTDTPMVAQKIQN